MNRGLILAAVAVIVLGGVYAWARLTQKEVDDARAEIAVTKQEAAGAKVQAEVSAGVANSVDQLVARERKIAKGVSRETESVRLAFGEDAAVEAVVAAWSAGIDRLREPEADAGPDPSVDRDPERSFRILLTHREAGDATARLAGYAEASATFERALLRGRCGAHLVGACGARPLDRQAV